MSISVFKFVTILAAALALASCSKIDSDGNDVVKLYGSSQVTGLDGGPVVMTGAVTTGGLTDTQLRATAVPVDTGIGTNASPTRVQGVDGGVPVPVSGTVTATGPQTDTQARATPQPFYLASPDGGNAANVDVNNDLHVYSKSMRRAMGRPTGPCIPVTCAAAPQDTVTAALTADTYYRLRSHNQTVKVCYGNDANGSPDAGTLGNCLDYAGQTDPLTPQTAGGLYVHCQLPAAGVSAGATGDLAVCPWGE